MRRQRWKNHETDISTTTAIQIHHCGDIVILQQKNKLESISPHPVIIFSIIAKRRNVEMKFKKKERKKNWRRAF